MKLLRMTILLISLLAGFSVFCEDNAKPQPAAAAAVASATQIRDKIADEEKAYGDSLAAASGNIFPPGVTLGDMMERNSVHRWLIRTMQNRLTLMDELASARKRKEELRHEISSWPGFAEKPPYSILFSDSIRDSMQSERLKLESSAAAVALSTKFIDESRNDVVESEKAIRQMNEKLESEKDRETAAGLSWKLEFLKIRSRVAAARIANYEIRRTISEEESSESRQTLEFLGKKLSVAMSDVSFTQADVDKIAASLDIDAERVRHEINEAETGYPVLLKALEDARLELRKAIDSRASGKDAAAGVDRERMRQLQELVETRSAVAETVAKQLEILRMLSGGITMEKSIWEMRLASYGNKDFSRIKEANAKLKFYSERIALFKEYYNRQLEMTSNLIAGETNRLQGASGTAKDAGDPDERLKTYRQRDELFRRTISSVDKVQRLLLRWKEFLDSDKSSLSFGGRMQQLSGGISSLAAKIRDFEVLSVDDTITVDGQQITGQRSVTVGKIGKVLVVLFIGYFICCFMARLAGRLLMARFAFDKPTANLARSWIKFLLIMILVFISLLMAKIPLTVFAFAGGALAIGIGFGMQNLLKNFISGIIILVEQPLRVGDTVDVGGTVGVVTSIGIRSSLIRNSNGIEVFIPNSTFLENDVINWTHSNRQARFNVKVGVAYGSSPAKVSAILAKAAGEHPMVLKSPPPQVLFEDFGDSALVFVINYWLEVSPGTDTRQIASDIRHMVGKRLDEENIAIPFPQQDVHLNSEKPLKIELVGNTVGDSVKFQNSKFQSPDNR